MAIANIVCVVLALISPASTAGTSELVDSKPPSLFMDVKDISDEITRKYERALAIYPRIIRSRLVGIRFDLLEQLAVDETKPNFYINLFDDQPFLVYADRTQRRRISGLGIITKRDGFDDEPYFIYLTTWEMADGQKELSIRFKWEPDRAVGYTVRRLVDTDYFFVVERKIESPTYSENIKAEVSPSQDPPYLLSSQLNTFTAEIGPLIDYGLADFSFGSEQVGYAIGSGAALGHRPTAYKTVDGGRHWQELEVQSDWVPREIQFKDETVGLMKLVDREPRIPGGRRECTLLRTTDGALTWERLGQTENPFCPSKLVFDSDGSAFAIARTTPYGKASAVFQSDDTGDTWQEIFEFLVVYMQPVRVEAVKDRIFLINLEGSVKILDKAGRVLNTIFTGFPTAKSIKVISKDVLFAQVRDELENFLIRTTDGGQTWQHIAEGSFDLVTATSADDIVLSVDQHLANQSDVITSISALAYTKDGGTTWEEGKTFYGGISANQDHVQRIGQNTDLVLIGSSILKVSTQERR